MTTDTLRPTEQLQTLSRAASYAAEKLPTVLPIGIDAERLMQYLENSAIESLKHHQIVLDKSDGANAVHAAARNLGPLQRLVEYSLQPQRSTPQQDVPAGENQFKTTAWDILVSERFSSIDLSELANQRNAETGKTVQEDNILKAAHTIAHNRIVAQKAMSYSSNEIEQQMLAAHRRGSQISEQETRLQRARKELRAIDEEHHPEEHHALLAIQEEIVRAITLGNKESLTEEEQRIATQHMASIKSLARSNAITSLTEDVRRQVQLLVQQKPRILQGAYWQQMLEKSLQTVESKSDVELQRAIDEQIISIARKWQTKLTQDEIVWLARAQDKTLTSALLAEGIGHHGIPLPYSLLTNELEKEHVLLPEINEMLEVNRRLSRPDATILLVLCPDYAREYNGSLVTYKFDGLGEGLGLVGEVGLPVILPIAERLAQINLHTRPTTNIPTIRLAYADIEATEGNISATGVKTKEGFLAKLDGSSATAAKEVIKYFTSRGMIVERTDSRNGAMWERIITIKSSDEQPLVRFSLGALTETFVIDEAPGEMLFAKTVEELREKGLQLLQQNHKGFIQDVDQVLLGRLPILLKMHWNQLEHLPGNATIADIARIHNQLAESDYKKPIPPHLAEKELTGLVDDINRLISQGNEITYQLNALILTWLNTHAKATMTVLRARHVMQLAEYMTVNALFQRKHGGSGIQVVGDSVILNQKAARGSIIPRMYIKGRYQYGGSLSQEELEEGAS